MRSQVVGRIFASTFCEDSYYVGRLAELLTGQEWPPDLSYPRTRFEGTTPHWPPVHRHLFPRAAADSSPLVARSYTRGKPLPPDLSSAKNTYHCRATEDHLVRPTIVVSLLGMTGPPSGAWTRFSSLFPETAGLLPDVSFTVISESPECDELCAHLPHVVVVRKSFPIGARSLPQRSLFLRRITATVEPQILHLEAFAALPPGAFRSCITLHDLRDFDGQPHWQRVPGTRARRLAKSRQLQKADQIIAISRWTSDEAQRILGLPRHQIAVVPNPIPATPDASEIGALPLQDLDSPTRFVLALGHLEARKNLAVLIAATRTSLWPAACPLVIAGRDVGEGAKLKNLAKGAGPRVIFLGEVHEETKWALLANATCLLLPSTLEGFGFLALEAPAVGTLVIAADSTALSEVVGTPATMADPHSPPQWAQLVARAAENPVWREQQLSEQREWISRYSRQRMAQRLEQVYRYLLGDA